MSGVGKWLTIIFCILGLWLILRGEPIQIGNTFPSHGVRGK